MAVRVVIRRMTLLLGKGKHLSKIADSNGEPPAQAGPADFVSGRAMVGGSVGLLPSPTLLLGRRDAPIRALALLVASV